jgi:hypothetical protein
MSIFRLILEPVNFFQAYFFGVPKCLLLTVLFVSKAADPLSLPAGVSTPAGSESYTRTEDHPLLPTGQQPSKQKEL